MSSATSHLIFSHAEFCTPHLHVTNIRYRQLHTQKDLHSVLLQHLSLILLNPCHSVRSLCSVVKASSCSKSASCRVCAMVGGVGRVGAEGVGGSDETSVS